MRKTKAAELTGDVYVLHFDAPIGNQDNPLAMAQHYTGWAENWTSRVTGHASGHSDAKIMAYTVGIAKIGFRVAQVFSGVDRNFERSLKRKGSARRYCAICRGAVAVSQAPHFGPLPAAVAALAA